LALRSTPTPLPADVRLIVLGAAAGGGFPQWNSNGQACRRARSADPAARPRTQTGIAVSNDGERWVLLNASPDLRSQIAATPVLWPSGGVRSSPIVGVVLAGGDVDAIAGLLHLRERQPLTLWATSYVLDLLSANTVFNVLQPEFVCRRTLLVGTPNELDRTGLGIEAFAVPGKVPLYREGADHDPGEVAIGLRVYDGTGKNFVFLPSCGHLTADLKRRLTGAPLVLFEGTFWTDDEMIAAGASPKSGQRMGHMSVGGRNGVIAGLAGLGIRRKVFVHINNTNPLLLNDSPERAEAQAAGWEVAEDGMEIRL
jgi:pyrroloquinoline quinone biosynthesis protein B